MKDFPKIVLNARKKLKLSREKFAARLGVSAITVFRWERSISQPDFKVIDYWIDKIKAEF